MSQANSLNRQPLYKVVKGSPKGATVMVVEAREKEALVQPVDGGEPFTKRYDSLERTYRTPQEREMGRDFTPEEAAEYERAWQLRVARITEERARGEIGAAVGRIAARLESAANDLRREVASECSNPAEKVQRLQHTLSWLFPNLGAHDLTREAIAWTNAARDCKRLEAAEPAIEQAAG